jgi:uncharacterized protein (TIGR04255 family)
MNSRKSDFNFDNPPVVEVICGAIFKPLHNFGVFEAADFWNRLRDDYPRAETGRLYSPVAPEMMRSSVPPLPRLTLKSSDESSVVQIQQNQFIYNWVRQPSETAYPHFNAVLGEFKKRWKQFSAFIAEKELGELVPTEFTLQYVDHIDGQCGWTLESTPSFITYLALSALLDERGGGKLKAVDLKVALDYGDLGTAEIQIENGVREADKEEILLLQTELTKKMKDGERFSDEELEEWFLLARNSAFNLFMKSTTEDAQTTKWGRQ